MSCTRVPALVVLSLISRAGAFVAPFSSSGARHSRSSSISRSISSGTFLASRTVPVSCCSSDSNHDIAGASATGRVGGRGQRRVSLLQPTLSSREKVGSRRDRRRPRDDDGRLRRRAPFATTASATTTAAAAAELFMSTPQEDHDPPRERPRSSTRADFLRAGSAMVGLAVAAGAGPQSADAIDLGGVEFGGGNRNRFDIPPEDNPDGLKSPRPLAYRVEYTDPPTTVPFTKDLENKLITEMAGQRLVFFGTHPDSAADQQLAAGIMGRISTKLEEKTAIGLEQVERQFQSALDTYVAGGTEQGAAEPGEVRDRADLELARATQWEDRCAYPFDAYRPLFHLARRRGLPLVALGVDSERVFEVMRNGMDSLGEDDRNAYVSDFKGFVTIVREKGFQTYADKLIFPSYERLKTQGLLGDKPPSKPNFFSARILADEALASKAVEWAMDHEDTALLVLQREDRVKFGFGASGRATRIAESLGSEMSTRSVLINPTAEDSLSDSRSLRLALEYANDLYAGKPLANYMWFSKSPKVNLVPRMLNPEDKGWLESVNLYDFREVTPT